MPGDEHSTAYPQSVQQTSKEKKQWYSYDESDRDSVYGFQRKKRFGTKNESDAVKYCLQWQLPATARNGVREGYQSEEEEMTEGRTRAHQPVTSKVGEGDSVGAQFAVAAEVRQLKAALEAQKQIFHQQQELTARLLKQVQTGPRPAWQQIPLGQVLDGETGAPRDLRTFQPQQQQQFGHGGQQLQNQGRVIFEGNPAPQGPPGSLRPGEGYDLNLAAIAAQNAFPPNPNPIPTEAEKLSARISSRKENQKKDKHDRTRKPYSTQGTTDPSIVGLGQPPAPVPAIPEFTPGEARPSTAPAANAAAKALAEEKALLGGEGKTHAPPNKKGLGNTMLGSPHDPRSLHDPNSIDPVWRKREEARERAKRLNALFGSSSRDKPIIDEKQYEASILKQHARRIKIKDFENRFTELRLQTPKPGSTTRDYSETWMSVVTGKPPFCSFGNGNIAPPTGGVIYGDYLLSHNVSPEKFPNKPNQKQSFDEARRVKDMKRKQDAKSLKRLLASGEKLPPSAQKEQEEKQRRIAALQAQYEQRGRAHVDVEEADEQEQKHTPISAIGAGSFPLSQQSQTGNSRNYSHMDSNAVGNPEVKLPVERALAWQADNANANLQEVKRSGRKVAGYDQVSSNTLSETSARTLGSIPQAERYPQQVW